MKKIIYLLLLGVLALTTSCEPKPQEEPTISDPEELVHSDAEISKIITILYNGMEKPASVCLQQFEEMGITLVKSEKTNAYELKNEKLLLSLSEKNDSLVYAIYELYTQNTQAYGIACYIKMDNIVYGLNWEKWCGGLFYQVFDLSQHEAVNKEIEEYATTCNDYLGINTYYEKKMGNKYLHADMFYWGVPTEDVDSETSEAINDKIKCQIHLGLALDKNAYSNLDDPSKEN